MKMVTGLHDGTIRIFSMSSGVQTHCLKVGYFDAPVSCVAWSPNGTKIATGFDDSWVVIVDVLTLSGNSLSPGLEPAQLSSCYSGFHQNRSFLTYAFVLNVRAPLSFELGGAAVAVTWHPSSSMIASANV